MRKYQPKCSCLQCYHYSFVYYKEPNICKCLECKLEIKSDIIKNTVLAFGVFNKNPALVKNFNMIFCIGCLTAGGVYFINSEFFPTVNCKICEQKISIENLHNIMTMLYKTKLIENSYNYNFSMLEEK